MASLQIKPGWRLATHYDVGTRFADVFALLSERGYYTHVAAALADGWHVCGGGSSDHEVVPALLQPGERPSPLNPA